MCSQSSYLPSLEGMPWKTWLAVCSMAAGVDFWRPILLVLCSPSVVRRAITCWCLPSPDLQPPPLLSPTRLATSSEAAARTLSLWWHVQSIRHMAGWLYADEGNRSQADPALLLQQMGEAWHSIFRQMPPPYSTCLEVGHCTERMSV